jgi:hypothetical protein
MCDSQCWHLQLKWFKDCRHLQAGRVVPCFDSIGSVPLAHASQAFGWWKEWALTRAALHRRARAYVAALLGREMAWAFGKLRCGLASQFDALPCGIWRQTQHTIAPQTRAQFTPCFASVAACEVN